jgi:hypothetical protein
MGVSNGSMTRDRLLWQIYYKRQQALGKNETFVSLFSRYIYFLLKLLSLNSTDLSIGTISCRLTPTIAYLNAQSIIIFNTIYPSIQTHFEPFISCMRINMHVLTMHEE